jgi:TIR domain
MQNEKTSITTRAFISYSWSSPTHEAWTINLATRLREDGVDVILDKWDLKPGHDAYQFMESMVTDKTVTKVMMICDKVYVEKANARSGGVGTESQIISPELYGKGAQDKFSALMTDEDDEGKPHVPVFYKGRIFIDFRQADKFEESYEELLRWLVDRPQYVKPKLGVVPEAILQTQPVATATQSRARRAEEAIRQASSSAAGLVQEYGDALYAELKLLGPVEKTDEPYDDTILSSVAAMRPYLRQLAEVVTVITRFCEDDRVWQRVLSIYEQLATLMYRDPEQTHWNTHQFDAHKIVVRDAFLTAIALALEAERFDLVQAALVRPYLVREHSGANRPATSDFTVFDQHVESLETRNRRLKLNRISLHADIFKEAHPSGSLPSFEALMQADFVLYLAANEPRSNDRWCPFVLVYASDRFSPFPLFARAESSVYLKRIAPILRIETVEEFKQLIADAQASERSRRMFDHHGLPVTYLANLKHLGILA